MGCKGTWSDHLVRKHCQKKWIETTYITHIKNVLLEEQKAKVPTEIIDYYKRLDEYLELFYQ